jgi:riboflavin biosynthesis pyrimidine reductase
MPLGAALLKRDNCPPWVFCGADAYADRDRLQRLEQAGASVKPARIQQDGFLDLHTVLDCLFQNGLRTLMVEGGARVLSSFLRCGLGDQALITIAPFWTGGDGHLELTRNNPGIYPHLEQAEMGGFGQDWVVWGKIGEKSYASSSPVFHSSEPG